MAGTKAELAGLNNDQLIQRTKDRRKELMAKRKAKRLNKLKRRTDIT